MRLGSQGQKGRGKYRNGGDRKGTAVTASMGVDGYGEAVLDGFVPASYGSAWLGS